MKIGVNTLFYIPNEVGGSETYLRQTLIAMAAHYPAVEFVLFTNMENDPVLREDMLRFNNVHFERLNFHAIHRPTRIIKEQTELPFRVKKAHLDVLWSPGYTSVIFCPCPQVVSILDMQYKSHSDDLSWSEWLATDILVKLASKRCTKVIAISAFSRSEVIKYTGASPDKVTATLLAVDGHFGVRADESAMRQILKRLVPLDGPYILTVANSYPHKNLHALVDSFGRIMNKIPHKLVMVGKPRRGEETLQGAVNSISDKGRLIRLSGVSRGELIALYQAADLFVFPSFYEGFGLPVLEGMLAGVPVITTKYGSLPEVGGSSAVYFDPCAVHDLDNKLLEVLSWDKHKRAVWCEAAVTWAGKFTWEMTAAGTMRVLQEAAHASIR